MPAFLVHGGEDGAVFHRLLPAVGDLQGDREAAFPVSAGWSLAK